MDNNYFESSREKWQRLADLWNKVSPPGRPSSDDIKNYKAEIDKALSGVRAPIIVLMGSTPELRDLLSQYCREKDSKLFCVDMTEDMYNAMTLLLKNNPQNETLVLSNWLEITKHIKPESVDLVVGDFIVGNVGGKIDNLYTEIVTILKKDGYHVTRTDVIDESTLRINDISPLFEKYAEEAKNGKLTIGQASNLFTQQLVFSSWFLNDKKVMSLSYYKDQLETLAKKWANSSDQIKKEMAEYNMDTWGKMTDKVWHNLMKADQEKLIKKYFEIIETRYSNDYNVIQESPIYLLKKK